MVHPYLFSDELIQNHIYRVSVVMGEKSSCKSVLLVISSQVELLLDSQYKEKDANVDVVIA